MSELLSGRANALLVAKGNGQTALQMAKERGHGECVELLAQAVAQAACARAEQAAAELLASDNARVVADGRLTAAMQSEDLSELRAALEACAVQASEEVAQRARSVRDRLKTKQKKAASKAAGAVAARRSLAEGPALRRQWPAAACSR